MTSKAHKTSGSPFTNRRLRNWLCLAILAQDLTEDHVLPIQVSRLQEAARREAGKRNPNRQRLALKPNRQAHGVRVCVCVTQSRTLRQITAHLPKEDKELRVVRVRPGVRHGEEVCSSMQPGEGLVRKLGAIDGQPSLKRHHSDDSHLCE